MKISASVYSNKEKPLDKLVKELDLYHVDYFHIDCNDDLSVFDDIKKIRKISKTPIDLHIISGEPEKFYDGLIKSKTELVSFQFENLKSPLTVPPEVKSKLGLAIVSDTRPEVFDSYKNTFDFALFMTTSPGKSGGTFNKNNFARIRSFKSKFPGTRVHVDGGVNDEISFVLRNMGVSLVVSGSYLVNANYIGGAIHQLRSDKIESHILVGDFMMKKSELPVLHSGHFSFTDVLRSIEDYNLGFTTVIDKDGKLEGIITNADVRRGLLNYLPDLNKLNAAKIINKNPIKAKQDSTVSEMLQMVKNLKFAALFLPVVDADNKLTGAVVFNNLIKGES